MITIKEVNDKAGLKKFVKFPFTLFKDTPQWVPPIIADELAGFDKKKNPVFEHAEAKFLLAYKNDEIVGRVAAIINHTEVEHQGIKKMRFGWFDVIDDIDVTKALINEVINIGKANHLEYVEGPVGFSNLDKVGVLTEGFNETGNMITWYSMPHYKEHLEQLGFIKEKEYIEAKFPFSNVNKEVFGKANELIKKRYGLRPLNFTKKSDLMPHIDKMFDLFNSTYSKLSSFVPISDTQKEYFKKKYIGLIDPEYIKFVVDENDELIAFSIVMPSFSEALQKANGKLFPFGIFHLLKAKKQCKDVLFYLIGVKEEFQNKGVTAVIFNEYYDTFTKKGIQNCIRTPELEDNLASIQIWKHFNPTIYKRRRTYRKEI